MYVHGSIFHAGYSSLFIEIDIMICEINLVCIVHKMKETVEKRSNLSNICTYLACVL